MESNLAFTVLAALLWPTFGLHSFPYESQLGSELNSEGTVHKLNDVPALLASERIESEITSNGNAPTEETREETGFDLPAYVVTLKSREDYAKSKLKEFGILHAHLVSATTPKELNKTKMFQLRHHEKMTEQEASCMWSHHRIYKEFLNTKQKYALIIEDDFTSSSNVTSGHLSAIRKLVDMREKGEVDWDLLNLGRCYDCCNNICETVVGSVQTETNQIINVISSPHPYCATSYIINRRAAEVLVRGSDPIVRQTDDNMLFHSIASRFKYLSISPRLFKQNRTAFKSTLHDSNDDKSNAKTPPQKDLECGPCGYGCYDGMAMPEGFQFYIKPYSKMFPTEDDSTRE